MTRIYYGNVYSVNGAVYLTDNGYDYRILELEADSRSKPYKQAYIKCGFDRELTVDASSKLILKLPGKKEKLLSIPFLKQEGRLVFDLPNFLKEKKIRFKLYKRDTRDCSGNEWNQVAYKAGFCNNGEIGWSQNWCIDYMEYSFWIMFSKKKLYIDGIPVRSISADRGVNNMDTPDVRMWFEELIQNETTDISRKDFVEILEKFSVPKSWCEIRFWDGSKICAVDLGE